LDVYAPPQAFLSASPRGRFSVLSVFSYMVLATGKERESAQWSTRSCFPQGSDVPWNLRSTLPWSRYDESQLAEEATSGNALLQSLCFLPAQECEVSTKEV
jgi:hypothetical protein